MVQSSNGFVILYILCYCLIDTYFFSVYLYLRKHLPLKMLLRYWQSNMNNVKANKTAHKESVRDLRLYFTFFFCLYECLNLFGLLFVEQFL